MVPAPRHLGCGQLQHGRLAATDRRRRHLRRPGLRRGDLGELSHYTYWYDHPPLGWIQIAGWTKLTDGFARYSSAVIAGRDFMVVCALSLLRAALDARPPARHLPSGHGRRGRVFAVSPLAVQFHRTVFLDNVATPWLLAAFVLCWHRAQLPPSRPVAGCFAIAVLSKETYLLFLPFLAWQMWRLADRGTRRYTSRWRAAWWFRARLRAARHPEG